MQVIVPVRGPPRDATIWLACLPGFLLHVQVLSVEPGRVCGSNVVRVLEHVATFPIQDSYLV